MRFYPVKRSDTTRGGNTAWTGHALALLAFTFSCGSSAPRPPGSAELRQQASLHVGSGGSQQEHSPMTGAASNERLRGWAGIPAMGRSLLHRLTLLAWGPTRNGTDAQAGGAVDACCTGCGCLEVASDRFATDRRPRQNKNSRLGAVEGARGDASPFVLEVAASSVCSVPLKGDAIGRLLRGGRRRAMSAGLQAGSGNCGERVRHAEGSRAPHIGCSMSPLPLLAQVGPDRLPKS